MISLDRHPSGRHFLQIPGPTNVPDRVLRAIDRPTIDHRGPEFGDLGRSVLAGIKQVFQTESPVVIYPSSGTGAWEAALVNTLSPGDRVLMAETGHFSALWCRLAGRLGLDVDLIEGDWRHGAARRRCVRACRPTRNIASRPSAWCTTKPPPAWSATSPRCVPRWTIQAIPRC